MKVSLLAILAIFWASAGATAQPPHRHAGEGAARAEQAGDHVIYHPAGEQESTGVMRGFPPPPNMRVTIDNYRSRFPGVGRVDVANTRWAHFHMREILPTQNISRGKGPIRVLPVRARDLSDMRVPYGCETISVSEWLKRTHTDALLVIHNGAIIHEEYFHGMREGTPHHLWSASKSISAGVVANLMAQGKLNENGPITKYIPELEETGYKGATLRDLLDMVSGVAFDYESAGDANSWPRWERAAGLARKLPGETASSSQYDFLLTEDDIKRRTREHGAYFYYKESDPQALAWACERVTQTRFSELISQMIWSRIGAEYDAYMVCDPAGASTPGGGMSATLRDLGRWGQSYLDDDPRWKAVPRPFVEDILKNYDTSLITQDSFPTPHPGTAKEHAYRSMHNIYCFPGENVISAAGNFGQFVEIFPKRKLVFVKLSTYDFGELEELFALTKKDRAAFWAIAEQLAGPAE